MKQKLLLSLFALLSVTTAWADVQINATNFPDKNFRNFLLSQMYGLDGMLSDAELAGITYMDVSGRAIKSLKGIEHFKALRELDCYQNQISGSSMNVLVNCLPTVGSGIMNVIYNEDEQNEMTTTQVAGAKAKGWTPMYLDDSWNWCEYAGILAIDAANFPDANFRNWVLSQDYGADGLITDDEIAGIISIDVGYKGIQSLKGIEFFTALKSLSCHSNQLTVLDVSKNTNLEYLHCPGNQLTALDVSQNTKLTDLTCGSNQLTALDVSQNTALVELYCGHNQLTTLDVSKNTKLELLYCCQNQIKDEGMDALVASLPAVNGGKMDVIWYEDEHNVMTTIQVAAAKAKGWTPYYAYKYNSVNYEWREYAGVAVGLAIDATNFPDANFRNYLLSQSYGEDGVLTDEEIAAVTYIKVRMKNIKTLKGIEYFTALKELYCESNQLTSLDLSKNIALTALQCSDNQLTTLDVSKFTALESLSCDKNRLTSLDLSNNTALIALQCNQNQLTSLDVSKCTALSEVLNCSDNKLTSLDVSKCTALWQLNCSNNQLTSLDVSNFTALWQLNCANNQLTALDVSGCSALKTLYCQQNQIIGEGMDALVASLPAVNGGKMDVIWYEDEHNVMTTIQVAAAKAKGWTPYYAYKYNSVNYEWREYAGVAVGLAIDATNFPDANFRNYLLSQSYGEDGVLTDEEIAAVTYINVRGGNIQSLKGIEYFTAMTELSCHTNQLTELDLSKNTELIYLNCYNNKLTALNLSNNPKLVRVGCYQNQIKGAAMDALIESLPMVSEGTFNVMYNENEQNEITTDQIATAKVKGWKSRYYDGSNWQEYSEPASSIAIDATNFPDAYFRNWVLNHSYGADGKLTNEEIAGITSINVSAQNIQNLKGIEYFTALTKLYCNSNQLTSLDVSQNTALELLDCDFNQLTSLDVSQNTALTNLDCSWNQLTTLDVSKNTALTELQCYKNPLTSLDVSQNTALTNLDCRNNNLTSLDVSQNTALEDLSCSENSLTSLDVSQNTALSRLSCFNNQLTSLDVSQNTALTSLSCNSNQLTSLDVSQNTALTKLYCLNNQLTSLDVSKNTVLKYLYCYQNQIKGTGMNALVESLPPVNNGELRVIYNKNEQNEMTTTQVAAAKAKGWTPYCYNNGWKVYAGSEPVSDIAIDAINFPDENFRNWVLSQSYGADGKLTEEEIAEITKIFVKGDIHSLKGIEFFTAITYLYCEESELTELDLSKNTALTKVRCGANYLTMLNVSGCVNLEELSCGDNRLTALDVADCSALIELECDDNQLTALDVSGCTALEELFCEKNQLTSLKVSGCTSLTELYCSQNQIKGAGMDALVESLPTVSNGELRVIYDENEQNVMTTNQVAATKAKGWIPYYCNNGWEEYAGSEPVNPSGDLNGDFKVDIADAVSVLNIMAEGSNNPDADLNNDGKVDIADFVSVLNLMAEQ